MPVRNADVERLGGMLGEFDQDTIVVAVREQGVNCPVFLAATECEGRRIAVDNIKKGEYLGDYFNLNDAAKKAEAISKFLKRFTITSPCTGGCEPASGKTCIPVELKFVATEGSADMTLMKGKLFKKEVGQYVLRANLSSKGDFVTECDCISPPI